MVLMRETRDKLLQCYSEDCDKTIQSWCLVSHCTYYQVNGHFSTLCCVVPLCCVLTFHDNLVMTAPGKVDTIFDIFRNISLLLRCCVSQDRVVYLVI